MNRRNFLGLVAVAAPAVFVPKLITVGWGIKPAILNLPPDLYLTIDNGAVPTVMVPFLKALTGVPSLDAPNGVYVPEESLRLEYREIPKQEYDEMDPGKRIFLSENSDSFLVHCKK